MSEIVGESIRHDCGSFLLALEEVRTKLAVIMAAETKAMSLERRQYYFETENEVRKCLKTFRTRYQPDKAGTWDWVRLKRLLEGLPERSDTKAKSGLAFEFCASLRAILAQIEQLRPGGDDM